MAPSSKCLVRLMGSWVRRLHVLHSRRRTIFLVVLAWCRNDQARGKRQKNAFKQGRALRGRHGKHTQACRGGRDYLAATTTCHRVQNPGTHLLVEHGLGLATVTLLLVLVPAGTLGELGGLASLVLGNLVHLVLTALLALAERTASLGDVHLNWVADGRQEVSQRLVCTAASTPRASHKRHTARHFMHRHITRRARPAAAVQAHRSDSRCTHHAGHMPCMMAANRTAHSGQNTGNTRTHGTRSTTPHAPS